MLDLVLGISFGLFSLAALTDDEFASRCWTDELQSRYLLSDDLLVFIGAYWSLLFLILLTYCF